MALTIRARNFHGLESDITIDREPDQCPHCHSRIKAEFRYAVFSGKPPIRIKALFECPAIDCKESFLTIYMKVDTTFQFITCVGGNVHSKEFDDVIKDLSENFIEIYNQSLVAENDGLDQIAGVGFRKALEFLIKDYSIKSVPSDTEKIKKMNLSEVINKYVSDQSIRVVSQRAVWLGNDETHYTRIWEGKTISDIKTLIELTLYWIKAKNLTEQLTTDMPDPKARQ